MNNKTTIFENSDNPVFNFSLVPRQWQLCFCSDCPQHEQCLRYLAGQHVPDNLTWGPAVYPTAATRADCQHFKVTRVIRAAYGFEPLFRDVKHSDLMPLRQKIERYLGSHGTYYNYQHGRRLLTPEQQNWILALFKRYGYADNLSFQHYVNVIDFS